MKTFLSLTVYTIIAAVLASCSKPVEKITLKEEKPVASIQAGEPQKDYPITLVTIDPGHFHSALVQKTMYPQVNPSAYVYAPEGSDVQAHLNLIKQYNSRAEEPTNWKEVVYTGPDFLQKALLAEKKGNVAVLAGNNKRKIDYITSCVNAGLHVYSDKPMVINPEGYELLKQAFETADEKNILLYDIMTERYEITTILQRELSQMREVFGELKKGSVDDPSVVKESVHHFFKYVSGNPLKRPAWFFDTTQQGEGIVDVTTHLVDLVMWESFPEKPIAIEQSKVLAAKRWATMLSPAEFKEVTQQSDFPQYLKSILNSDGSLPVYSNGQIDFAVNDVHARVKVLWNYRAPEGAGDTHYSIMKGTKANIIIRQGKDENYRPELYVEAPEGADAAALNAALFKATLELQRKYPGVRALQKEGKWHIAIPDRYRTSHETHFAQVTEKFLKFMDAGKLPAWEIQNMLTKYYITTKALQIAQ